jgi:hypothetical protein
MPFPLRANPRSTTLTAAVKAEELIAGKSTARHVYSSQSHW